MGCFNFNNHLQKNVSYILYPLAIRIVKYLRKTNITNILLKCLPVFSFIEEVIQEEEKEKQNDIAELFKQEIAERRQGSKKST